MLAKPKVLNDGSLQVDAVISRAGVFRYDANNGDGHTAQEYRSPEEVFRADSMNSFIGMAVTDDHPYAYGGLVTLENRKLLEKGFIQSVRRDGMNLVATMIITDAGLIKKMQNGKTATSSGYMQDDIAKDGVTPSGERYDRVQTNIRGNHVAIVDCARAGDIARVRMDAATMIAGDPARSEAMNLEQALAALALANVKIGELNTRLDSVTQERDTAKKEIDGAKARLDSVTAERDAAKDAAEKAEKLRLDSEGTSLARARERIALEDLAGKHLRTDAADPKTAPDVSKMKDPEIRTLVCEKLTGKSMAGKTEAYVSARLDAALEDVEKADGALESVRVIAETPSLRADANGDSPEKARAEMINRHSSAWKTPEKK